MDVLICKMYYWVGWLILIIAFTMATHMPLQEIFQVNKSQSSITYMLDHSFHTVNGLSREIDSELTIDQNTKEILSARITVPVKSFDSGNKNRDKDMLQVTNAARFPNVQFKSKSITAVNGELNVKGLLTFNGVTKEISTKAVQIEERDKRIVKGNFVINLENYAIKRPSIFGLKVKNELVIYYDLVYINER
jgi:polyisoprenoid-binding protein YceI